MAAELAAELAELKLAGQESVNGRADGLQRLLALSLVLAPTT